MFNTFSMMLLKFKCITVLAFLIVECYVLSSSAQLNIDRGERDVFDNPNCDSRTGEGCRNCDDSKATCVNGTCKRCICPETNGTFVPSNDTNDGQCVKNRHLLFILASSNSFLVQQTECMKPVLHTSGVYYVQKAVCDAADLTQRWVWTQTNQLMNVALWKCLEQGPEWYYKGRGFWYIIVETCSDKAKQLWSCQGQTFFLETPKLYMNSRKSSTYVLVTSDFNNRDLWTRYLSRENFCTKGSCNVKTTQGECCVFPLLYLGKEYYSCTTVNNGNTPWCLTNITSTKWGNCSEALSNSFLFQSKKCMIANNGYLAERTCNVNNLNQHWIWTPNNQLMHVDTLKCLQQGKRYEDSQFWYLVLQECNSAETKQFWKCQGQKVSLRNNDTINVYMIDKAWVTTHKTKYALSRYSSGKYLCSKAFGCYEFVNPSSAVLLTDTTNCSQQCFQESLEREISVPHNIGESLCFVMWEKLQYLNNDQWKQLTFRDEIFIINKKNTRTFLQLNFRNFTNRWIGLIVKLYFYCAERKMTNVNLTVIKCVVVKFEGTGSYPPIVLPTTKVPTFTTSSTGIVSNSTSAPEQRKNNSSNNVVITIVVCVVMAILILCGILGFIFYKRKRRSG